jgi:hypothetical protein
VRRGGEQPEANVSSVTTVNSIRPVVLASLLVKGEALNGLPREGTLPEGKDGSLMTKAKLGIRRTRGGWRRKGRNVHDRKQGDLFVVKPGLLARASQACTNRSQSIRSSDEAG